MRWKRLAGLSLLIAGLMAAGAIVTDRRASAREAAAEAAYPPEGEIVTVEGRRVHAVVRGSGPDLVLIHGSNGSIRDFSFDMIDRLSREFRVIAFDRPGLGWTDRADDKGPMIANIHLQPAADQVTNNRAQVNTHVVDGVA